MHESGQRELHDAHLSFPTDIDSLLLASLPYILENARPLLSTTDHSTSPPPLETELNQLTGVAAILTFPLDVEVVEMEERMAKEEEELRRAEGASKTTEAG